MKYIATILATLIFSVTAAFGANGSAAGYWKTVDDKTGQVLSIVQIYPAGNGLEGKIVKIMPVLGQKDTDKCVKCKGNMQGKPMLGLRIIWDMQQIKDNTWGKGRVLDPKSGNIYQGTMTLIGNDKLKLRGYVGVPMFGRSETWVRANNP